MWEYYGFAAGVQFLEQFLLKAWQANVDAVAVALGQVGVSLFAFK